LPAQGRVLAVAMPHTPAQRDLPGAEEEAACLRHRFPGLVTVLSGPDATHDTVLARLPAARRAHFACHGFSDLVNPSASRLLLHDHQTWPLTVIDVARLNLDDADLAFLSACSTAQPGTRLTDEAIQLAAAFQLAGYRHVIGTLWPVGDQQAVDLADAIYATITKTGDPALAVHADVRHLRNRYARQPSAWASHIHVGA
jgi:CHAT domain-containing protein